MHKGHYLSATEHEADVQGRTVLPLALKGRPRRWVLFWVDTVAARDCSNLQGLQTVATKLESVWAERHVKRKPVHEAISPCTRVVEVDGWTWARGVREGNQGGRVLGC